MRPGLEAALALAMALGLASCQAGSSESGSTSGPGSSGTAGAVATLEPATSVGPPPSPSPPDDTSPAIVDANLLAVLPESIDGVPVTESIDEAAVALTDPAVHGIATALDVGVAIDTASANLLSAHVVKLRPDAFTDDTYRQWRDSFDDGACAGSGGVVGLAEATIDERTVYVTSCIDGLRTYHVWLKEQDTLISASSIGEGRFGEKLMDNLRVPA